MTVSSELVIWHPLVHKERDDAELVYYLFRVWPSYDKETIFTAIADQCKEHKIFSYGIYEVFGSVDLIFRAWIPRTRKNQFAETTKSWANHIANGLNMAIADKLTVNEFIHHWRWKVGENPTLASINALDKLLNNGEGIWNNIEKLKDDHLLREKETVEDGIRFIMILSGRRPHTIIEVGDLCSEILSFITSNAHAHIINPEIYYAEDNNWLLVDARVNFPDYFDIAELQKDIILIINKIGARTSTYLCTHNINNVKEVDDIRDSSEWLSKPLDNQEVENLLEEDESRQLEIKGSLRVNIGNYLYNNTIKSDNRMEQEVLGAIAAFLNTNGGNLIIGAFEPDKVPKDALEKIGTEFPLVGKYCLFGTNHDFKTRDKFKLHLMNIIRENITPLAESYIDVSFVIIRKRRLCVLSIKKSRDWHYLKGKDDRVEFYIREDGSSIKLNAEQQAQLQGKIQR